MVRMTSVVKRVFCLAAVVACLVTTGAGAAETPYVISAGSGDGMFSVSRKGEAIPGTKDVSIDSALSVIRKGAAGEAVEIRFDTTGGGLNVLDKSVRIESNSAAGKIWGDVTLSGKLKGNGKTSVVELVCKEDTSMLNVENKANIVANGIGGVIRVDGDVRLVAVACTLSAAYSRAVGMYGPKSRVEIKGGKYTADSGDVVYSNGSIEITDGMFISKKTVIYSSGSFKIIKGTFKAESEPALWAYGAGGEILGGEFEASVSGEAIRLYRGDVVISGNANIKNNSKEDATVLLNGGSATLIDATIENQGSSGNAIRIASVRSRVTLGDTIAVKGTIESRFAEAIFVDESFKPGARVYSLNLIGSACVDGAVAVVGGRKHLGSFSLSNDNYELITSTNKDVLLIRLKPEITEPEYIITGDWQSELVAKRGSTTVGKSKDIDEVLSAISVDAKGIPCSIRFGESGAWIDVGNTVVAIRGKEGWGRVSLSGKIKAEHPNVQGSTSGLYVSDGASVVSTAELNTTSHAYGVVVQNGADFTYKGSGSGTCGNIRSVDATVTVVSGMVPYISNDGESYLGVSGGTVGSDTRKDYAISNTKFAQAFISGTANVLSANARIGSGTIYNSGWLNISGGTVSNANNSPNGESVAIINGPYSTDTMAVTQISGNANIFSYGSGDSGVVYNKSGEMMIFGGQVYNKADTVGAVVVNTGKLVISGSATIESGGSYNKTATHGAVYSQSDKISETEAALVITGGSIIAKDGYAVSTYGSGGAVISGNAKIITDDPSGAVYIGAKSYLKLFGGTVSSKPDVNDTTIKMIKAIDAFIGGQGGAEGRLEMGGSPVVNGIISLPNAGTYFNSPITINVNENAFNPINGPYYIAKSIEEGGVVLENGAKFISSFVLDTIGNRGLKLAVNGNDVVAAKNTCSLEFTLHGITGIEPPQTIPVMVGGRVGEMAKPSTADYMLERGGFMLFNDGKWYIRKMTNNVEETGDEFLFGTDYDATQVNAKTVLTLFWCDSMDIRPPIVSVLEPTRDLPAGRPAESAAIAPPASYSGGLTAGPSPVSSSSGAAVGFFRSGAALKDGKLFIYDASGSVVAAVAVRDNSGSANRRPVAKWNLQDAKGRKAAEGTYVARGVITTKAGKIERVSVLINVRK